jgi:hypothetical protein
VSDEIKGVARPNEEYDAMSLLWHLVASLRGGTPAMRDAGRKYLPQEPKESEEAYKNRLDRSVLTNLYKKTVTKLVGKPLKKGVKLLEDVPPELVRYETNIDNQGTNLNVFARDVLEAAIDDGVTHILVDYSDTQNVEGDFIDGSLTVEQEELLGVRPYAKHVKAADLIGWKWQISNNKKVLTQIRVREYVKVDGDDEFTQEVRERIRVIEPYIQRVYEKSEPNEQQSSGDPDEWVLIEAKVTTMPIVPLVTMYTNKVGFLLGSPLLLDIAYLNVAHWQSDSDQRNILHVARIPILFATGFGDDDSQVTIEIGSNTFARAPKGATLEYVEHTGKGIDAGVKDLKDLEERIQLLGMELLVKRPQGNVTATARTLDQAEADSELGLIAKELENTLNKMLDLFGRWVGLGDDGGGSTEVFKDFGIESEDLQDVDLLLRSRMAGEISQMTFWDEIKRRGLLSDNFNPTTEINLLDIESGGSINVKGDGEDDDEDSLPGAAAERRNQEGDTTSEANGHTHVLQANGVTDTVIDENTGESHSHTWDELAIRTSVDAAHSHILLVRAAAGSHVGADAPSDTGEEDVNSSEGIEPQSAQAAGSSEQLNRQEGV